jgi:hypothetical protein
MLHKTMLRNISLGEATVSLGARIRWAFHHPNCTAHQILNWYCGYWRRKEELEEVIIKGSDNDRQ